MKFQDAWDSLEKENRNLKILCLALCTLALFLTVAVTNTASKDPLIIERACYSKTLATARTQVPTSEEIQAFVEKALSARFNTTSEGVQLLSDKQRAYREKEQLELTKQKMIQKVIVSDPKNDLKIEKDFILVNADRLISIQNLRTVLRLPLKITLESTERSEGNPYGLLLSDVVQLEDKKE
jgi:hypothetical protein